jgi:hypothetical protein
LVWRQTRNDIFFLLVALITILKLRHGYQEKSKIFGTYSACASQRSNGINHTYFTAIPQEFRKNGWKFDENLPHGRS